MKNLDQSLMAMNVSYTNDINEREINSLVEFENNFDKPNE